MNLDFKLSTTFAIAVLYFMFGGLWYSEGLFGPTWHGLLGLTPGDPGAVGLLSMAGASLASALVINVIVHMANARSFQHGMVVGVAIAIAVASTQVSLIFFQDKAAVFFINESYHLISYLVMGGISAKWRKL